MNRVKIGVKIAFGFTLAVLCLVAVGVNSYVSMGRMSQVNRQVRALHTTMLSLERLSTLENDTQTRVRGFLLTGEDSYLAAYHQDSRLMLDQVESLRPVLDNTPEIKQRLNELESQYKAEQQYWEAEIAARRSGGLKAAGTLVATGDSPALMTQMRRTIQTLENLQQLRIDQGDQRAQALAARARLLLLWGTCGTLLLVLVTGALITRNIAGPLQDVTEAAGQIAEGNFAVHMPASNRGDEIGALTRSFLHMADALRGMADQAKRIAAGDLTGAVQVRSDNDLLGAAFSRMNLQLTGMTQRLKESAAVLTSSVREILASVTEVNSGVTETAASVTQTTATVEEVRQTASLSNQKARAVSEIAQRSVEISQQGKKSVDQTISGMEQIRLQMEAIAGSIVRLSEHGQSISEIILVVNDLAEQSNLLAVNAAIEAARAGEHGKGFAVVAQEVRSLAEQSRQATAQIRSILNEVQKATSAAVMTAEQGSKAVDTGIQQVAHSGAAMQQMENSITESAQAAIQIAASSQQQLVGMDQIADAIESIKQASLQNVASVQQVQAAARHLQSVGEELERLVQQYRTAGAAS